MTDSTDRVFTVLLLLCSADGGAYSDALRSLGSFATQEAADKRLKDVEGLFRRYNRVITALHVRHRPTRVQASLANNHRRWAAADRWLRMQHDRADSMLLAALDTLVGRGLNIEACFDIYYADVGLVEGPLTP